MVTDLLGPSLYKVLQDNNYHPFPMSFIRPILSDVGIAMQLNGRFSKDSVSSTDSVSRTRT